MNWLHFKVLLVALTFLPEFSLAETSPPVLFSSCKTHPWPSEFDALKASPAIAQLDEFSHCMRLTDSQFLITANPAGPYNGPASNLYYCDLTAEQPQCVVDRDGHYFPNLKLVRQFNGPNGKRFVLWETSLLRRGLMSTGYHVLSLVPRSKAPRGYEIYPLGFGQAASGEDEKCRSDLNLKEAIKIQSVDVLHEGTERVLIRFTATTLSCDTDEMRHLEVDYSLVEGKFASRSDARSAGDPIVK